MSTRKPNERLARLHREAGWTHRQFAQLVNRLGTERGTPTAYQRPSISQWLSGQAPKEETRPLIVEALSRRLRRPVTYADAGFPTPPGDSATRTVDGLIDLGSQDMSPSRRGIVGAGLFSVALTVPNWPDVVGRMEAVQHGTSQRVGMSDVRMVTNMTERISELDDQFGGRHARPMAAAFLVNTVAPYLRADATEEVRKAMLSAAAFLSYLTGYMAVDEGLQGLAQRYYVKALELAGASADHMTYCHVLRGMSVQAADLGHGTTAARLADAAAVAAPSTTPRMTAFLAAQQAHAYAVAGERTQALRSLRETETAMDKAESAAGAFGGFSPATVAYAVSQVRYALGDAPGSVSSLKLHFRLRDSRDSQRSRLRFGSMLAERQLEMGHLEEACSAWSQVLDQHPAMHSGRVDRHVASISPLLKPYRANPTARAIYDRAAQAA
ncbi:tetratricopeptide repeat protein [Streptomyces sp. NPDC005953]|uniref:tetratricopeptide repeat protein n=1 Tax=unclassified Streptomyces TaxID=2593676 RepID=UPI0033F42CD5